MGLLSSLSFQRCIADKAVQGQMWNSHCSVSERPDLGIIELELASLFGTGIAMSSWTWTSNTLQTWQKLWRRSVRKRVYSDICAYLLVINTIINNNLHSKWPILAICLARNGKLLNVHETFYSMAEYPDAFSIHWVMEVDKTAREHRTADWTGIMSSGQVPLYTVTWLQSGGEDLCSLRT